MTALAARDTKVQPLIHAKVETITPRDAARYLKHNAKNRPQKPGVWRRLADAMRRGEWMLNGESIKFAMDGSLLDGQHRLLAVVESGVTIESLVIRGLPNEAQDTVDIGNKRTSGDILHLHGYSDQNNLAGALTYYHRILTRQVRASGPEYRAPTPQELLEILDENPEIVQSISVGNSLRKRVRVRRSQFSALHYWLWTIDHEDANLFFDRLETGENLQQGNPIYALRRWLEQTAAISKFANKTVVHAVTIKAWNAYRQNESMSLARWRAGIEDFPEPV